MERVFGDLHDCCTRDHWRPCVPDLVADLEGHWHLNGLWQYKLSDRGDEPAVTAAVEEHFAKAHTNAAA
jgi:hypothetical protein